ncbi:MAG: HDOD domain-containing protein [Myxococcales bacterium]|nr:HDOD domain-containing protein [Myxococcales bacterium]
MAALAPASNVNALLEAADRIGLFPAAAHEIFDAFKDPEVAASRLESVVGRDPVLTGRILKTANSPYYGRQRRVGTIEQALVVLGFHVLRDLAVSFALVGMSKKANPAAKPLWRHMLSTGALAASLARHVRGVDSATALVLGTMHDMGELVMLEVEPKRHAEVLARMHPEDPRIVMAERLIFGIDHAALGAACILQWGLPPSYAAVVRTHHEPEVPAGAPLDAVVRLADAGVALMGRGLGIEVIAADLEGHPANRFASIPERSLYLSLQRIRQDVAALTMP